jgi:hypothetical protein
VPGETMVSTGVQQAPSPAQPPAQEEAWRPRRRGSMVGYIEDAVIESKLRVRFDAAFRNAVPDRAEFFYAKCGCYRELSPLAPEFDPDAPGPLPGIVTDLNFQELHVAAEYAFSPRVSAFAEVPIRWLQPQMFAPGTGPGFPNESGLGDVRGGVRVCVVAAAERSVTAQLRLFAPSGDASRGLGTDHASAEPALLYHQRVTDRMAVESQIGAWLPFSGSAPVPTTGEGRFAGDILFYGAGTGIELYRGPRVSVGPVVEIVGWRVLNGFQTATVADASGTNIVNLKFGARMAFGQGSLYAGYGRALTNQSWYDDVLRLEYRFGF